MLRWRATDSQAGPDVALSVQDSDIVQVALLQSSTLMQATSFLHLFFVKPEATVHDQVRPNQNGAVTLSWRWRRPSAVLLRPGHNLEIKSINIVEEIRSVPSAKDDHLGATNEVCGVVETSSWSTATFWALVPCHCKRI